MDILIFILYLILFAWLLNKIHFVQKSGLSPLWITGLFLVKVAAGIAYGWYYSQIPDYQNQSDTWKFYFDSLAQTKLLLENPLQFFRELVSNAEGSSYGRFFSTTNSFWTDLKHLLMVKLMSIFNSLSGSRYYTNVIFYSFITFFGPVAFLRIMNDVFPGRKLLLTVSIFLVPSFLFWCSGIHKEGIIFLFLSIVCYMFYAGLKNKKNIIKYGSIVLICILIIFSIRNYIALAVAPFLLSWWIAEKWFQKKWIPFLGMCVLGCGLFFGSKYIVPVIDAPAAVILRKQEFTRLGGQSILPQRNLEPSFISFLKNAPQALNHSLVRPYITEIYSPFYFLCAIEILLIWIMVFIWYFRYRENMFGRPVIITMFMFSFVILLLIGYIVPQLGAIVRYRSIFIPFIIAPIVATIRWRKSV
jgi:hypothetical protein